MGSDPYRYEGRLTDLALDVLAGLAAAFAVAVAPIVSAIVANLKCAMIR